MYELFSDFRLFRRCCIAAILFVVSLPGYADLETGLKAVETGDYLSAWQSFKTLAKEGNAEAQHNLAVLLKTGKGVMQNSEKAAKWFRKAADQGLEDAAFNLGRLYDKGEGVEQSGSFAAIWYRKAAEKGHALAQTNLGVLYANGEGVTQDLIQAYVWFNLAAAQGIGAAFENREALSEHLTDEMKKNVRKISRDYFMRFVAPYNPPSKSGHSMQPGLNQPHSESGHSTQPGTRNPHSEDPHGSGTLQSDSH